MVKYTLKNGKEIYMDGYLVPILDSFVYNIKKDWDFVILITGDRMVRTGKSMLAQTVCSYLADKLGTRYTLDDIYFDAETMREEAEKKPKYSINHYDEARESLASSKHLTKIQQNLIDFFNECGQLNQIFILVLPDFFTLKEEVAVGRSECLINVYRKERESMIDLYKEGVKRPIVNFQRGFFQFFNRRKKLNLYDIAKTTKKKNYSIVKSNFVGSYTNNWVIDEQEYLLKKREALKRFKEAEKKEPRRHADKLRDNMIMKLTKEEKLSATQIIERLEKDWGFEITKTTICKIIKEYPMKYGVFPSK